MNTNPDTDPNRDRDRDRRRTGYHGPRLPILLQCAIGLPSGIAIAVLVSAVVAGQSPAVVLAELWALSVVQVALLLALACIGLWLLKSVARWVYAHIPV